MVIHPCAKYGMAKSRNYGLNMKLHRQTNGWTDKVISIFPLCFWGYQNSWDQVPSRRKHPLSTGQTHNMPIVLIK